MQIRWIYKIFPVLIRYLQGYKKEGKYAGTTNLFYVRIDQDYINDPGILEHEVHHGKQFWTLFLLMIPIVAFIDIISFIYLTSYSIGIFNIGYSIIEVSWILLLAHSLFYLLFQKYRLASEVDCYKVQLWNPPAFTNNNLVEQDRYRWSYAQFIATRYNIDISKDDAYQRLLGDPP